MIAMCVPPSSRQRLKVLRSTDKQDSVVPLHQNNCASHFLAVITGPSFSSSTTPLLHSIVHNIFFNNSDRTWHSSTLTSNVSDNPLSLPLFLHTASPQPLPVFPLKIPYTNSQISKSIGLYEVHPAIRLHYLGPPEIICG